MRIDSISNKGRPAEILLVEDNYGDVVLAKKAFQIAKIANRITVAGDGVEALAVLRREGAHVNAPPVDLILLDLNLPKKDGKEVLAEIKADADLRRIPVVVLTSSRTELDVVKSYNLHANSYVVKPVNLERFGEIVRSIEHFWFTIVVLPDTSIPT
jgi:chemotaxis family two-component system response regulator Rcp1